MSIEKFKVDGSGGFTVEAIMTLWFKVRPKGEESGLLGICHQNHYAYACWRMASMGIDVHQGAAQVKCDGHFMWGGLPWKIDPNCPPDRAFLTLEGEVVGEIHDIPTFGPIELVNAQVQLWHDLSASVSKIVNSSFLVGCKAPSPPNIDAIVRRAVEKEREIFTNAARREHVMMAVDAKRKGIELDYWHGISDDEQRIRRRMLGAAFAVLTESAAAQQSPPAQDQKTASRA